MKTKHKNLNFCTFVGESVREITKCSEEPFYCDQYNVTMRLKSSSRVTIPIGWHHPHHTNITSPLHNHNDDVTTRLSPHVSAACLVQLEEFSKSLFWCWLLFLDWARHSRLLRWSLIWRRQNQKFILVKNIFYFYQEIHVFLFYQHKKGSNLLKINHIFA